MLAGVAPKVDRRSPFHTGDEICKPLSHPGFKSRVDAVLYIALTTKGDHPVYAGYVPMLCCVLHQNILLSKCYVCITMYHMIIHNQSATS